MSKPKYLKLLMIVEEDYTPITGELIPLDNNSWSCENVMSIKLTDGFAVIDDNEFWSEAAEFLRRVLAIAKERSNE